MTSSAKIYIDTIAEYHRLANLPAPAHPLISVTRFEELKWQPEHTVTSVIRNFYTIALKKTVNAKFRYGQEPIYFNDGVLHFMAPKQIITIELPEEKITNSGWLLLIHPDFFWNTILANKIKEYEYFSYNVNEALHLSEKEEKVIVSIIENISQEYLGNIDDHTDHVILAQIELLLAYSSRFYQRQFAVRKKDNHHILDRLELLINEYFRRNDLAVKGIPSIQYISDELQISPGYLSRLLQTVTGQSTQHFLHDKLIELAKEKLSTTALSVSEIAYELGFQYSQSFCKLFKTKTNQTPSAFRQSFMR